MPLRVAAPAISSAIAFLLLLKLQFSPDTEPGGWPVIPITGVAFAITIAVFTLTLRSLQRRLRQLQSDRDTDSHAALHDELTGAANRRQFEQKLERLVVDDSPAHALLMIDLDRFKPVNDLYGHAAGDALLQEITNGLKQIVNAGDVVARLGGDEFAMLLCGRTRDSVDATAIAVLDFVRKYRLNWDGQRVSVGASIGLVGIEQPGLTPATLLAAADEALYMAKEAGRGAAFSATLPTEPDGANTFERIDIATPEPVSSARSHEPEDGRRQELRGTLMLCLKDHKRNERRREHGARRRHEVTHAISVEPQTVGSNASPGLTVHDLMVDSAARADGGADLARWMLAMTLRAANRLTPAILGRTEFVMPIPAQALVTVPTLADELMRHNALSHRPIRHLTIVLHNVHAVYDSPALKQAQQRFKHGDVRLGFEIRANTLDVLAPLRHIAYDELHLGRELIRNLRPGGSAHAAVEALLAVTVSRDMTLVASSVDSDKELRHLTRLGVKRFAGKVLGEPQSLDQVLGRLNAAGPTASDHTTDDDATNSVALAAGRVDDIGWTRRA